MRLKEGRSLHMCIGIHTYKIGLICVGSWENRADVAGLAFELGRLKVKKIREFNFFFNFRFLPRGIL